MSGTPRHTREELAAAVSAAHSWRGVLRALDRPATSAGALRAVRRQVDAYGIDHSHFTGQRRWSEQQLAEAVAAARTWPEVPARLGLADGGGSLRAIRAHAARLGVVTSHLETTRRVPTESGLRLDPRPDSLRVAGTTLAAAWFMLRGHEVLWPIEPCRYDLAVRTGDTWHRVQVKTVTYRAGGSYQVNLANARRRGRTIYDAGEIDCFFVIDADLNAYLIPFADVSGYVQISLRSYREYLVAETGQWMSRPDVNRAAG